MEKYIEANANGICLQRIRECFPMDTWPTKGWPTETQIRIIWTHFGNHSHFFKNVLMVVHAK